MKKRSIIISIICTAIILILLPIALDWYIFGNKLPSNLSNSDWSSFLGGYIGSIIASIFSVVGILISIKYSDAQNRKDREIQIRPFFDIRYESNVKQVRNQKFINKILGYYSLVYEPIENQGPELQGYLIIKNAGIGSAVNIKFVENKVNNDRKRILSFMTSTAPATVNALLPGEEGCVEIHLHLNYDKISSDDIIIYNGEKMPSQKVWNKYNLRFDISTSLFYEDILGNKFKQDIVFVCHTSISFDISGNGQYSPDLSIKSISNAERYD